MIISGGTGGRKKKGRGGSEQQVKWSKRARTPSDLVHELRRACFVAESTPLGPTLLEIPFDLLLGTAHDIIPPWLAPVPVIANPEQIDGMAKVLADAAHPIIITEHGGRTEGERKSLVRISEALSAPVFEFMQPAYHNFPRTHPLYGAGPVEAVLGEADAVDTAGRAPPATDPNQSSQW